MASYLQTGNTVMFTAGTTATTNTIVNPQSATLQLLNTGSVPVFITVSQALPSQPLTVQSVSNTGLFSGTQTTTLPIGSQVVIGGTQGAANVVLTTGTYYVVNTNGLATNFMLSNVAAGGHTYIPATLGNGNISVSSYTFTQPAGPQPAAPVVPTVGTTSSGYALPPNVIVHLTTAGYRSGDIVIQSIVSTGTAPVYVTPVLNIGDQDATV